MYTVRTQFYGSMINESIFGTSFEKVTRVYGQLNWNLNFEDPYHVLTIHGFSSEAEATLFLGRIPTALAYLLLLPRIAAQIAVVPQEVTHIPVSTAGGNNLPRVSDTNLNQPINRFFSGPAVDVYPSNNPPRVFHIGNASIFSTMSADHVLESFIIGANLPGALRFEADRKLNVALQLYREYFNEQSANAKFLTLIMALEALAVQTNRSQVVLDLLERWAAETRTMIESVYGNDADEVALQALEQELFYKKTDSISMRIRKLVATELGTEGNVAEHAKQISRLYGLRSKLVHDGFLEPGKLMEATNSARVLVHRVLCSRFQKVTAQIDD